MLKEIDKIKYLENIEKFGAKKFLSLCDPQDISFFYKTFVGENNSILEISNHISKNNKLIYIYKELMNENLIKENFQYNFKNTPNLRLEITEKGKYLLENYKNRNIFDKFEDLMKKYPNSIKIPLSFITGIIATIITLYIKTLIK